MNNINILIYLLEHQQQQFTINHLAKAIPLNYRIAHTHIKQLEKENIVQTQKAGNALLCSLTHTFNEKLFQAEYERRNKALENKTLKHIAQKYAQAKQTYILLLFGSQVNRSHNKHSDIDLLAITENPSEIEQITTLIPKNIHLTTVTYNEFLHMKNSKQITVGTQAMKKNIILIGIEEYYRLLQHD